MVVKPGDELPIAGLEAKVVKWRWRCAQSPCPAQEKRIRLALHAKSADDSKTPLAWFPGLRSASCASSILGDLSSDKENY
jgi:hypothetical protein